MNNIIYPCGVCKKNVKRNDKFAECSNCKVKYHQKCLPLYLMEDLEYAKLNTNYWSCPHCLKELFPLYTVEDKELRAFLTGTDRNCIEQLSELLYDPFESNEERGVFEDIDPDDNYLNVLASQSVHKCKYYLPSALKDEIDKRTIPPSLSMLHLNIRSTKKNFNDFQILLNTLEHTFTCIALTETWLKNHNVTLFDLEGYNHEHIVRENKMGGGISLYIRDDLISKTTI